MMLYSPGDLGNRLPPQAMAGRSPRPPPSPAGKGALVHGGCCWRRAPLHSPQAGARAVGPADGAVRPAGRVSGEQLEGDGVVDGKRPTLPGGNVAAAAGPTAEAEGELCHGAGPTVEAEGGPCHGAGPTEEAEGELCHGAGPTAEAEGEPYHGGGPTVEAAGGPCHGAGHRQGGSAQDHETRASKDGAFKELAEPHKQQWRCQKIQAGKGSATTETGLSEPHPCPAWERTSPPSAAGLPPAGPVTVATAAVGGQAQAGEKVGASDCEEPKEAEEHDDEFGTFEKAGNPVQWAEFAGPLWPEGEDLRCRSGTTAGRSQEAGDGVAAHGVWRRRSENAAAEPDSGGTVQRRASLHGSSSRAAGSWESRCPLSSAVPSHALTAEGGWRPFHAEDSRSQGSSFDAFSLNKQRGVGGEWWSTGALEHHTFQMTSPSEASLGSGGLESVFHSCFPAVPSASSSHAIPPLGQLLGNSEEKGAEGFLSAQACDLWASLQDVDEAVGLKYKWAECRSRRLLLASLLVDPASADTSAGHTRTLGSSPLSSRETRMELHPSPASSERDSKELMLIKNSVPQQPTNGFSPTHRIQAFFYHWTQADRNGKSKTPYDVNKNFMA